MPVAAIVTLVAAGVVVLVLAGYLLYVGWMLQHVTRVLDGIVEGLDAISRSSEPLGHVVDEINEELVHVEASVDAVAARLPDPAERTTAP
jgi:uncharacterized protein YoxC